MGPVIGKRPWWWAWWLDGKALAPPMLAFQAVLLLSLAMFTALLGYVINVGMLDPMVLQAVAGLWIATLGGTLIGQVMAILRVRGTWFATGVLAAFTIYTVLCTGIIGTGGGALAAPLLVTLFFLLPFFVVCGWCSLQPGLQIVSAWGLVVWFTSTILWLLYLRGTDHAWFEGYKFAVWDPLSAVVLAVAVASTLFWLVLAEGHRVHRWTRGVAAPVGAEQTKKKGSFAPLSGCGTVIMAILLAIVVTTGTALISPYLWRTGPADEGDHQSQGQPEPEPQPPPEPKPDGEPWLTEEQIQQLKEAAEKTMSAGCMLMQLLVLTVLGALVFGPPLRRVLLVRHLRSPFWPVPPTNRVGFSWRMVEIALADAGIARKPGESPVGLVKRAEKELPRTFHEPLAEAAAAAEQVMYGYGLDPGAAERVARHADMAYTSVWERMSEGRKAAAMYRWL